MIQKLLNVSNSARWYFAPWVVRVDLVDDLPVEDELEVLRPGGSVRGERANFTRLVLGCIEAKFCK